MGSDRVTISSHPDGLGRAQAAPQQACNPYNGHLDAWSQFEVSIEGERKGLLKDKAYGSALYVRLASSLFSLGANVDATMQPASW